VIDWRLRFEKHVISEANEHLNQEHDGAQVRQPGPQAHIVREAKLREEQTRQNYRLAVGV